MLFANEELKQATIWHYPYPEIVDHLKSTNKRDILLFSYGSLMDTTSASRTLSPESLKTRRPAIAFKVKRLFDRDVPIKPGSKWGIPDDPRARGMLNVLPTDSPTDMVNGVLIDVALDDIPNILLREEGYDLIPVIVQEWNSTSTRVAYTLHAPQNTVYTNTDILPRPGYYELTRDAALQFGPAFYLLWYKTTFLSDGVTPVEALSF